MKDLVSHDDFAKLDIRIARIVKVEEIDGADKLLKLTLDVGPAERGGLGTRVVVAGIKELYKPEDLEGKLVPYLANLEPRVMRGVESVGMILAAATSHKASSGEAEKDVAVLLHPGKEVARGSMVR